MPRALFEGKIVVVQTAREAQKAVDFLKRQPILGLDTETRPNFKKNMDHKVCLLQVSTLEIAFLFRLNFFGLTPEVMEMLSSNDNIKVGLSFQDDVRALHKRADFKMGQYVELQKIVGEFGITDKSLQKLYANLFKQRISKGQRLSNWEVDVLSESQKRYAATDAWACVKIYNYLQELKRNHDFKVISGVSQSKIVDQVVEDSMAVLQ